MRLTCQERAFLILVPVLIALPCGVAAEETSAPRHSGPSATPLGTVRDFGAVGDGVADDTAALQKAVDAGIGDVILPRGVYRISKPIVVDLDKVGWTSVAGSGTARIVMTGPGPALKFIGTHGGTADPNSVKPDVYQRQRMPTVDGLEIIGPHPEACGIEATGTMKMIITRVTVREALHGIHLTKRNRNVIVSNCHLYKNRGVGLYLDDVNLHQINVTGCHVSYNAAGGIVVRGGNVRNLHVTGCDIEANRFNVLVDSDGAPIGTGEVAIVGCTIQHSGGPDSANVRFIGADDKGRRSWGFLIIADNVLSDVETGIDVRGAQGASITGNVFGTGYKYNLRVVDSSNVVVGPNVFSRNPRFRDEKTADNALLFRDCEDCTLSGLHVNDTRRTPAGLVLENCRRFNVTGCTILDCEGAGLLLKNVSDSRVSDCLIRNDRADAGSWLSLKVTGGSGNMIVNNLLGGPPELDPKSAHTGGNVGHE